MAEQPTKKTAPSRKIVQNPRKPQGPQLVNWIWVLNNYTQAHLVVINSLVLTDKVLIIY